DPDRVRGRGAWLENDSVVVHLGDRLLVDGDPAPLIREGSPFIYEAARPLLTSLPDPLPTTEAHKLAKICSMLKWERPISARLAAGWIVLAPICGVLDWRPSAWVTGPSGSGKTYFVNDIVLRAVGKFALHVKMPTSAAFVSSYLGSDARPVVLDEAESENARSATWMQQMLELVRQGSAADDGIMGRGTQTGGAIVRRIRSPFLFQSVNVSLEHRADTSRITVLSLIEPGNSPAAVANFRDLKRLVAETLTPEFSAGLVARAAMLAPVIRRNAVTFAEAIAEHVGSRREGDQIGALLAGAYSLHSTGEITPEAAREFVAASEWLAQSSQDEERDETRLLRHLLAHPIRTKSGDIPVARLLEALESEAPDLPQRSLAAQLLAEFGILNRPWQGEPGLWISTKAPTIAAALKKTPWSSGWGRALGRLPGAAASDNRLKTRFAFGMQSRAVFVPRRTIDGGGL
ncbi:MAG: hypothetical protein KGK13_04260, partial [Rhodospirillales bacterium]|nr:hypothetical protein [Rhodospirillales bacterium]